MLSYNTLLCTRVHPRLLAILSPVIQMLCIWYSPALIGTLWTWIYIHVTPWLVLSHSKDNKQFSSHSSKRLKEGVISHSQSKVRFEEYFKYFLTRRKSFEKSTIRKVFRTLISHINNYKKLLTNSYKNWLSINFSHSIVILKKYFENSALKSCNIAKMFIKLLERFIKYCRNLAMSV